METVVLVNAAPGYEERVASALREEDGVAGIAAVQEENFNMAILLQVDGPNKLQKFLTNTLMFISGVQGAELDKDPSDDLMERLQSDGPGGGSKRGGRGRGGRGRPSAGQGQSPGPSRERKTPSAPDREPSTGTEPGGRTPGGPVTGGRGLDRGRSSEEEGEDIPGIDETDIPGPGDHGGLGGGDPDLSEIRGEKKDDDEDDDED